MDVFEQKEENKSRFDLDATIAKILEYEKSNTSPVALSNEEKNNNQELKRRAEIIIKTKEIEWDCHPYIDQGKIVHANQVFDGESNFLLIEYINENNLLVKAKFFTNEKMIGKIKMQKYHIIFSEDISDNNSFGGIKSGATKIKEIIVVN